MEKKVIRDINDNLSKFSSSGESDEHINMLIKLKCAFRASGDLLFSLHIINQTPDKVRHLPFKQKGHGIFLNYLL